ncbi:hypothetical protein BH09MYX1_BH09MYX1_41910 [soil metagenome]
MARARRWVNATRVAVLAAGIGLSVSLFFGIWGHERDRQADAFGRRANDVSDRIERGLREPVEVLQTIPPFILAGGPITEARFSAFAKPAMQRHSTLSALEYAPIVSPRDRAAFERDATADFGAPVAIVEPNSNGTMIASPDRTHWVPLRFIEPDLASGRGLDITCEPERRAVVERAIAAPGVTATARFQLVEDPKGIYSIAVYAPVRRTPFVTDGVAIALFRLEPVVREAMRGVDAHELDLALIDLSAPVELAQLHATSSDAADRDAPYRTEKTFAFADRKFAVRFVSAKDATTCVGMGAAAAAIGLLAMIAGLVVLRAREEIARLGDEAQVARTLGQYVLEGKIGEGGMGTVYKARHAMMRRPAAIKLVRPEAEHPERQRHFDREVQTTSELSHPNTIAVWDYGRTPDGVFYYAMEFVEGVTLEDYVQEHGPMKPARVIFVLAQVCGALAEAHTRGLIHRDLTPANVMLTVRGGIADFVKVLDFGLVKVVDDKGDDDDNLLRGTPSYMAPEALTDAKGVTASIDVYAVGAIAYFLLAGRDAFSGKSTMAIYTDVLTREPPPPSTILADIPDSLDDLVMRCLAKDKSLRPASADALRHALLACIKDTGPWTEADATAWWAETGKSLALKRASLVQKIDSSRTTIEVALEPRRPKV